MRAATKGPENGTPDLDDVRQQLALSVYFYRKMKGMDHEVVPERQDLDVETRTLLRQLVKQSRGPRPPEPSDLFKMPFWLP